MGILWRDKKFLIFDFETYSEADLKSVGAFEYSKHPSTDVICIAFACANRRDFRRGNYEVFSWTPLFPERNLRAYAQLRVWLESKGVDLVAHNAFFDALILRNVFIPRYMHSLKKIQPKLGWSRFRCTSAQALAMSLPRKLEHAAEALKLGEGKDTAGNRLVLKWAKPRRPSERISNDHKRHLDLVHLKDVRGVNARQELKRILDYCESDIRVTADLFTKIPILSEGEQRLWELTQTVNERGFAVDRALVGNVLRMIEREMQRLDSKIARLTRGEVESATRLEALRQWCRRNGYAAGSLNKAAIDEALASDQTPERVKAVLRIRQVRSLSSTAKYERFEELSRFDGRMRGGLVYHAASTGRWGGALLNPQNFPRGSITNSEKDLRPGLAVEQAAELLGAGDLDLVRLVYGRPMEVFSSCLRTMIIPSEGHVFDVADYSQIEVRVLFWMAGHTDGIRIFSDKTRDIYCEAASAIFGRPASEIAKDSWERFVGKEQILGCGYGLGAEKFKETMAAKGKPIEFDFAQKVIDVYRHTNRRVTHLWHDLESAAVRAVLTPFRKFHAGRCTFEADERFLYCTLPSGRRLSYHEPKIMYETKFGKKRHALYYWTVNPQTKKRMYTSTYGGKLTENCFTAETRVLTSNGWKPIVAVDKNDRLFDGIDWVHHEGVVDQGIKKVMTWLGVRLTENHLILAGKNWKRATDLDEQFTQEALKLGRDLVPLKLLSPDPVNTGVASAVATVAEQRKLKLDPWCAANLTAAGADIKKAVLKDRSTEICSRALNWLPCGRTGIAAWSRAAITRAVKPLTITERVASASLSVGLKIVFSFLNMSRRLITGIKSASTWIESTIMPVINQAILDLYLERLIAGTDGNRFLLSTTGRNISSVILPKSFALNGQRARSGITSCKEKTAIKLQNGTEYQRVYDIVNAGPRHRFVIMTDEGPVIAHNCVQATARDIMAHAKLAIEASKTWKLVLSVHDELIAEREIFSEKSLEDFIALLKKLPPWAEGCPIDASGWSGNRYRK